MLRRGWLVGALIGSGVFIWLAKGGWNGHAENALETDPESPLVSSSLSAEQRLELIAPRQEPLHLIPRMQQYGPS
jgi:hypothetical protein